MTVAEQMVAELAQATGEPLELDENDALELVVEGETVFAHYEEDNSEWVISGVVHSAEEGEDLPPEILGRALSANLLGVGTGRLYLGLFGRALVLAGRYPVSGMSADDLGADILFVAGQLKEVRERVLGTAPAASDAESPETDGKSPDLFFMRI